MERELLVFPDPRAAARAVAESFGRASSAKISRGSRFFAAFSGGSTPRFLFEALAGEPFRSSIAWPSVEIFFVDERVVPPDDPQSNFRLLRDTLLSAGAIPDANVHRWKAELGTSPALLDYERALAVVARSGESPSFPAFDFIALGLGEDGHTASLFPGTPALAETSRPVAEGIAPVEPRRRLTLTLPVLNSGVEVVFLVAGGSKAPVLHEILRGPDCRLPAARVAPRAAPPKWFVDRPAASLLASG